MSEQPPADTDTTRVDPRFPGTSVPGITAVRLSPGDAVDLLNISKSGVLVEGKTRFVPGTRVTVIFDGGFTPAQVKGKVVRCQVSSISGGALRYQSGIQFEKRLEHALSDGGTPPAAQKETAGPSRVPVASRKQVVNRW